MTKTGVVPPSTLICVDRSHPVKSQMTKSKANGLTFLVLAVTLNPSGFTSFIETRKLYGDTLLTKQIAQKSRSKSTPNNPRLGLRRAVSPRNLSRTFSCFERLYKQVLGES